MNNNINYDKYLVRSGDLFGGVEFVYEFPNNYSVVLIQHDGTKNYKLNHWTMITYFNDVKINTKEDLLLKDVNQELKRVLESR
jgi:hypothetical protein